ncbi:MAG: hypothetical protein ACREJW_00125 [Candidatus Methylomirabilales bacterium]
MRTKSRPLYNRSDVLALLREAIFHLDYIEARSIERRRLILDLESFLPDRAPFQTTAASSPAKDDPQ